MKKLALFFAVFASSLLSSEHQEHFDSWCRKRIKEARLLRENGENRLAMQALNAVLARDPYQKDALNLVGFGVRNKILYPRMEQLLKNGWTRSNKRWTPNLGFDFENYERISERLEASVVGIVNLSKKDKESAKFMIDELKRNVKKIGVTAVPQLTKLAKSSNSSRQAVALSLLTELRPEHLDEYLMESYPREKNAAVAAAQASVLASLHPKKVPPQLAHLIERGSVEEAMRVSQLAALVGDHHLVPPIIGRWVKIREEIETRGGGSRNVITVLQQRAYTKDLTAILGLGFGLFDPVIGTVQSGGVQDVRVVKVEIFRSVLMQLTGIEGHSPEDFQ